jgi:hypothetical protein
VLASQARLLRDLFIHDLDKILLAGVLLAIGLFVIGLYLTERSDSAYLYYGAFALLMGIWELCQMRSRHLLLAMPLLWTHVEFFALYLTAAFMGLFLWRVVGRGPLGLIPILAGVSGLYAAIAALLVASGVLPIMTSLVIFEILVLPILGYYFVSISALLLQGNPEARLFAGGFVLAMSLAATQVMGALGLLPRSPISLNGVGQGVFVITLGLILVRRFRRVHQELMGTKHELSDKLQALQAHTAEIEHLNVELRHQIEARSSLLVTSLLGEPDDSGEPPPAADVLPVGALLNDRYRVLRLLGQGAMGTVYEVERVHDRRHFAAKVLCGRPHRTELARFAREAKLLARLRHDNLVSIADIDVTATRQAYIVMELVTGTTLTEESAHYGELDFVLPVLAQLADALAAIHAAGIVHREPEFLKSPTEKTKNVAARERSGKALNLTHLPTKRNPDGAMLGPRFPARAPPLARP